MPTSVPEVLAAWMQPFGSSFTPAVWRHILVLLAGVVFAPGRRTSQRRCASWPRPGGGVRRLPAGLQPGPLVLPRRRAPASAAPCCCRRAGGAGRDWLPRHHRAALGAKIKARGIYHDPIRSSHGHFVRASDLRWLCVMLLAPISRVDCVWALPFLTGLALSEQWSIQHRRRHKKRTD
jgi:hypothetical protein